MAGFTNATEQGLLDYFIATYVGTNKFIGLSSTTPAEDGTGFTEPSTGSYARIQTTTSDWAAATGGAPSVKPNTAVKTFATATADWLAGANLTYFGIFSLVSAGVLLAYGQLTTAKPVLLGDTASFAAGSLVIKLGDPGETF